METRVQLRQGLLKEGAHLLVLRGQDWVRRGRENTPVREGGTVQGRGEEGQIRPGKDSQYRLDLLYGQQSTKCCDEWGHLVAVYGVKWPNHVAPQSVLA